MEHDLLSISASRSFASTLTAHCLLDCHAAKSMNEESKSACSTSNSTHIIGVEELPEEMDILDDFELPSLDELLQILPESSDNGVSEAVLRKPLGSFCGHSSPCSHTSVGTPAGDLEGVMSMPGQLNRPSSGGKGFSAPMAIISTVPVTSPGNSCSTDYTTQPAVGAPAKHSRSQAEKPTSSNDSNMCGESPQSSADKDGCHKRRRTEDGDAGSSEDQEDGGTCSPGPDRQQIEVSLSLRLLTTHNCIISFWEGVTIAILSPQDLNTAIA